MWLLVPGEQTQRKSKDCFAMIDGENRRVDRVWIILKKRGILFFVFFFFDIAVGVIRRKGPA